MNLVKGFQNLVDYIAEGFARIFGANDDQYPNIGVQPYEGEPNTEGKETP